MVSKNLFGANLLHEMAETSLIQPQPASPAPHNPTHTMLTVIPNSLQLTELHYAHQLPSTNPVPNSKPDQS